MDTFNVGPVDIGILIGYLILSRAFALWITRGGNSDSDGFFLGGRKLTWPLIGFSLFATNMSGASFVGLAGEGYNTGISVYSYEWMAAIILIFFVLFVLPFYLRSKVYTMPEFLERRYDRRSRYVFAGLLLILNVFLDCAAALYAGGLVLTTIFPDWPLWGFVAMLAILSMILSATGGLGAVVVSDTIQAVVLYIGGAIVLIAAWSAIPSWEAVKDTTPPDALSIIQPLSDDALPWPGLLSGVLVIGIYFWVTNQVIVQRTLGASSVDQGRWGALFAGALKLPVLFIMILPGTMAVVLYPELSSPDKAFPTLAFDLLPAGIRGLVLSALIAAITSSVDSILNSASTLMTMDVIRPLRPKVSDKALVRIGRLTTVGVTAVAILWAPQIANFPSLWQYMQSALSYVVPPVVAVFGLGIFWPRTSATAAFAVLAAGLPLGLVFFVLVEVMGVFDIQFLYASGLSFVISLVALAIISPLTKAPVADKTEELIWTPDVWHAETEDLSGTPWWQNYRYQCVALALATAIIVGAFW